MLPTTTLDDLLRHQDRVLTRSQLTACGVSAAAIRWNAGRNWRVLLPRVYLLSRESPTEWQRHRAALLWAGPGAVLSGPTAAALHGIRSAGPGPQVRLLVPAPKRSRQAGYATARRTCLEDRTTRRDGLQVSSVARSAVDAAVLARGPRAREAILVEAVQRRLTTVDDLAEWVYRLRVRDAASVLLALEAAASGAWSVPEHDLLALLARSSTLPEPWANPRLRTRGGLRLTTPDVWLDDVGLAVMVHSHRHHSQGDEWDDTVAADSDLVAAGVVVVGVTPRQVRRSPDAVLRRIERAHAVAADRPHPAVVASHPESPLRSHHVS
ncbi:hypothetical protein KC207_06755 [Phycicoccus sp. BSK3Z-2]|uniref:Transcriptional regulator, AbiEi antitoxin, Type IV TA system n=1 Tax=Phycicoccus avicenniae TaxID=2828860 RepID=A0A941HZK3_9MICO|nr:hypothetical protein [Phycicoccus avicenniae]MBR7742985.1 hypothetical protein [Phycicoccus avicenniae]